MPLTDKDEKIARSPIPPHTGHLQFFADGSPSYLLFEER
jgi:hypothetical protein